MPTPVPATEIHALRAPAAADDEPYQSLFVIGRGGMGSVEVALERGPDGFERVVALKRLLPESARDPRRKQMFLREAHLASLLTHRNVVHTLAFGELGGELFLAMEYVEGEPLSRVLGSEGAPGEKGRALGPALVSYVLAEVCEGLHAAHELRDADGKPLQVVHRDVSPHNVMIAYEGDVKLLDFGVAKFEASGHETRTGEVKGKMAYMSPEQALGERLDRRTDLFSVGAVLFECLTGSRMWGSGTDLEIMRRLALEEPPRLDHAWPAAPPALVDLHARLVARDPQRRPVTALVVAEELRAFVAEREPFSSAAALRELMLQRFAPEAQRRRALLTESLERAAPSRADILRLRLGAEAPRERGSRSELVPVPGPARRDRGYRRMLLVCSGGIALALAAAVAWRNGDRRRVPESATAPVTLAVGAATAKTPGLAVAAPATVPQAVPTESAVPSATRTLSALADKPKDIEHALSNGANTAATRVVSAPSTSAIAPAATALRGLVTPAWSPRPIATSSASAPSPQPVRPSPARLPDVDPTPF